MILILWFNFLVVKIFYSLNKRIEAKKELEECNSLEEPFKSQMKYNKQLQCEIIENHKQDSLVVTVVYDNFKA